MNVGRNSPGIAARRRIRAARDWLASLCRPARSPIANPVEPLEQRQFLSAAILDTSSLLNVSPECELTFGRLAYDRRTARFSTSATLRNMSDGFFSQDLYLVLDGLDLSGPVAAVAPDGFTDTGHPFYRLDSSTTLPGLGIAPGALSLPEKLVFSNPANVRFTPRGTILEAPRQRILDDMTANPDTAPVGVTTLVTATVQIGADPDLIPESVNLYSLASTGASTTFISAMFDDGVHGGDLLPGDGTFTAQFNIMPATPGVFRLVAQAGYRREPTTAWSDVGTLNLVALPSETEINTVLANNTGFQSAFDTLRQTLGDAQARAQILAIIRADPDVASAILSDDGTSIYITYASGLNAVLLTGAPGTNDDPNTPDSNQGSALAYPGFANAAVVSTILNDNTLVESATLSGAAFTLDAVEALGGAGVIYLDTHGGMAGSNVIICTGETATLDAAGMPTTHVVDWFLDRAFLTTSNYWAFAPSFIRDKSASFAGSLVVTSACDGLKNNTMAQAFLSKGAQTYVGWSESVGHNFAATTEESFFQRLAGINHPVGDPQRLVGDTVQEAFNLWTNSQRTDPNTYSPGQANAVFKFTGDGNLRLPIDLIKNGGFETGDLTNWITGFTPGGDFPGSASPGGYWTAIGERTFEGSYAARIGRFDQPYLFGSGGSPQPDNEPAGYDWIAQDVTLPADGPFTLSFSWKMRTYDTAIWDWIDVTLEDPTSGAILANIVSHDGKPGSNYGPYWENGWQQVSYSLNSFAGQSVRVKFACRQDGWGDQCAVYVDKVSIRR